MFMLMLSAALAHPIPRYERPQPEPKVGDILQWQSVVAGKAATVEVIGESDTEYLLRSIYPPGYERAVFWPVDYWINKRVLRATDFLRTK